MKLLKRYLRPAGDKILLQPGDLDPRQFYPYSLHFYHSGTAALAAALIASRHLKPDISAPEVILPAYGCPDLISAVIYAGARPVLVDLEPDSPWMSLEKIESYLSDKTVAVIAVNLLGIQERMARLREICIQKNVILIEDSAQAFPNTHITQFWQGDFNIISFGRGKPVNMLGGGAVLCRKPGLSSNLPVPGQKPDASTSNLRYILKVFVYNTLISPVGYNLLQKLPFLNIGETRFKTLHDIYPVQSPILKRLNTNISYYETKRNIEESYQKIFSGLDEGKYHDLIKSTQHDMKRPLLRFPLLIHEKKIRDSVFQALKPFGASIMYQKPLYAIEGANRFIDNTSENFPNAAIFSDKLLTLPLHEDVTQQDIRIIQSVLNRHLG